VTGVVVGVLLIAATVIVVIVVYRKSGYVYTLVGLESTKFIIDFCAEA